MGIKVAASALYPAKTTKPSIHFACEDRHWDVIEDDSPKTKHPSTKMLLGPSSGVSHRTYPPALDTPRRHGRPPDKKSQFTHLSKRLRILTNTATKIPLPVSPLHIHNTNPLIFFVVLSTSEGIPSILLPPQALPAVPLTNGKRGSIVKEALDHFKKTHLYVSPEVAAPCFLAADFTASQNCSREVTIVIPLLNANSATKRILSDAWAWHWSPVHLLCGSSQITRHAQAALFIVRSMSAFSCPAPKKLNYSLGSGAPFALCRQVKAPKTSTEAWILRLRTAQHSSQSLANALLLVTGKHQHYCTSWLDRIVPCIDVDIPVPLREAALQKLDSSYDEVPFSSRYITPSIPPFNDFRQQPHTAYKPTSLEDIVSPLGVKRLFKWLSLVANDLLSMQEDSAFKRKVSAPLVITEQDVKPQARNVIWDLRTRHFNDPMLPQGFFKPLDMNAKIDSILDHSWFSSVLGSDFPDKELLGFIRHGVSFKTDMPLITVLFPHSVSLPLGFKRVEKEIKRFLDLGWYTESFLPPFWPLRALPQGVVERKLEVNRPRRTTNGSAPHDPFVFQGELIKSTNDEINLKNSYDTTWPREVKPRLEDVMRDAQILRRGAQVFDLPLFNFTDDAKDYYMHLKLHPSVLPFSCLLWLPLISKTDRDRFIAFISELVLGFGISASSNIAQRLSWALVAALHILFDKVEKPFFDNETKENRLAWIRSRRKLTVSTGEQQCRLYSVHMYTDDPVFTVVGIQRTIRLLMCWREVTQGARLAMAVPAKREMGCGVTWNGCKIYGDFGIVIVLPQKRMRAICSIQKALQTPPMAFNDYRSLTGFLQHLVVACGQRQEAMYALFEPHKKQLAPNQPVWLSNFAKSQLRRWTELLSSCSGSSFVNVFQHNSWSNPGVALIALYSDACKADAEYPGLGGFAQGFWWRLSLTETDLTHLNIPQLELIAFVVNIIVFAQHVGGAAAICYSDSLTSTLVLQKDAASQHLMQHIHSVMLELPTVKRMLPQLAGAHIYGEANPMADYASRNMITELCNLCTSIGLIPHKLQIPTEAWDFICKIKTYSRSLTATEQMRGSQFSNNTEGDGPTTADANNIHNISDTESLNVPRPPPVHPPLFTINRHNRSVPRLQQSALTMTTESDAEIPSYVRSLSLQQQGSLFPFLDSPSHPPFTPLARTGVNQSSLRSRPLQQQDSHFPFP